MNEDDRADRACMKIALLRAARPTQSNNAIDRGRRELKVTANNPMKQDFAAARRGSKSESRTVWLRALGTTIGITIFFVVAHHAMGAATITFIGVTSDQTSFQALGFGQAGYYFPQFATGGPVTLRPTWENMRFNPPSWAGFQFINVDSSGVPTSDRTFSLDAAQAPYNILFGDYTDPWDTNAPFGNPLVAGVYSKGGQSNWNTFTLPDGTSGLSGAVVDEWATDNSNNSVNRIQFGPGTPSSFLLRLVVDNTNLQHDPAGALRARAESGGQADASPLAFNGIADVYTFRYDGCVPGDFIKIRLNSGVAGEAPSIGGIMFDLVLPILSIQTTNSTQLVVSWPASTPSTFVLETTTNLTSATLWTQVTNAVAVSSTNKFVILDVNVAESERYYRLKQ